MKVSSFSVLKSSSSNYGVNLGTPVKERASAGLAQKATAPRAGRPLPGGRMEAVLQRQGNVSPKEFSNLGAFNEADIEALMFIVLMLEGQDAAADMKAMVEAMMAAGNKRNEARVSLREFMAAGSNDFGSDDK
jgi:hypothetical protein